MSSKKIYHEDRKTASVRLSPVMARRLAIYAAAQGESVGQTIVLALDEWWEKHPERKKYESLTVAP